jgi:hypothetical protein
VIAQVGLSGVPDPVVYFGCLAVVVFAIAGIGFWIGYEVAKYRGRVREESEWLRRKRRELARGFEVKSSTDAESVPEDEKEQQA